MQLVNRSYRRGRLRFRFLGLSLSLQHVAEFTGQCVKAWPLVLTDFVRRIQLTDGYASPSPYVCISAIRSKVFLHADV